MRDRIALCVLLIVSLVLLSCGTHADEAPNVEMRVRFGLGEPQRLGEEVDRIVIELFVGAHVEPETWGNTLSELSDLDGDGRPEWEHRDLPVGVPLRFRIIGEVMGRPEYIGHVGPIRLRAGERRTIEPLMFRIDEPMIFPEESIRGRFLHTATTLSDGRVLIAGGFDSASLTSCPPEFREGSRCFELRATNEAHLYDPSTGQFHPVANGMLETRAGHTATLLADGRVLLAGGAHTAMFVFVPQGPVEAPTGYRLSGGASTARATFELFEPEEFGGRLIGSADAPDAPGRLDRARVFATAALVPGTQRVLIAGGQGDPSALTTYAIFDPERAGGYGVLETEGNALSVGRLMAASVSIERRAAEGIWIFGGVAARSDADLAEIWTQGESDPNGASRPATEPPSLFPRQHEDTPASHPEWGLLSPLVATIGDDTHILVSGWYGALCGIGDLTPVFSEAVDVIESCDFDGSRSFTVDTSTGLATGVTTAHPHAFGAVATLDDDRVLLSGGIASLAWNTTRATELFTGGVDSSGAAERAETGVQFEHGRFWHSSSPLVDSGVLISGGVEFGADWMSLSFAPPEVIYFSR